MKKFQTPQVWVLKNLIRRLPEKLQSFSELTAEKWQTPQVWGLPSADNHGPCVDPQQRKDNDKMERQTIDQATINKLTAPGRPATIKTASGSYYLIDDSTDMPKARSLLNRHREHGQTPCVYRHRSCVELTLPAGVVFSSTRAAQAVRHLRQWSLGENVWTTATSITVIDCSDPRAAAEYLVELGARACDGQT
ncbi:MAG: hypothetical protein HY914_14485 [Desulfomonile tiedjei]|nr:hypothetical protein [Desulfomonile tiedjei]